MSGDGQRINSASRIDVRPFTPGDRVFLARVAERLYPGPTVSARDPDLLRRYFDDLAESRLLHEPETAAFVATVDGMLAGIIVVHPDVDYFTRPPSRLRRRPGRGTGSRRPGNGWVLLHHVEAWARERGFLEVVLDVFAVNEGVMAFYERCGCPITSGWPNR